MMNIPARLVIQAGNTEFRIMKEKQNESGLIPQETIEGKILLIRGKKVILDRDLAVLYEVQTKALKQAVRRNSKRFPDDFMFELTTKEFENWRSQIVTSSWGGTRKLPRYLFWTLIPFKYCHLSSVYCLLFLIL